MPDFSTDVSAWVRRASDRMNQVFQATALDAVNRVKELTPVDTGFLRSNWTAILQNEAEPIAGRVPDPTLTILKASVGNVIIVLNPVVYARRIEYGFVGSDSLGRHFNQSGHHMMGQTVAEMPSIAQRALARFAA